MASTCPKVGPHLVFHGPGMCRSQGRPRIAIWAPRSLAITAGPQHMGISLSLSQDPGMGAPSETKPPTPTELLSVHGAARLPSAAYAHLHMASLMGHHEG